MHVPVIYLVHVGLALQIWGYEIPISLSIIIERLLIEVIPGDVRNVLQVMQRGYLRHLGRER